MSWVNFLVNSQKPRSIEAVDLLIIIFGRLLLLFKCVVNKELFVLLILNGEFCGWFGGICGLESCELWFGGGFGFYNIDTGKG